MRFARHARIFRGPLDPAPIAAVLMLLMLFVLLGSLVYTPGVLIDLNAANANQIVTVTRTNAVSFAGKTYKATELDQLRADLKTAPGDGGFSVAMQAGADPALGRQVSNLFQVALPDGKNLIGTDDETVMVAVDFRGQCFYENRLVHDSELKAELARRLKMATRDSRKLTLLLRMDKSTEYQVFTRLSALAYDAGITKVLLVERPPILASP